MAQKSRCATLNAVEQLQNSSCIVFVVVVGDDLGAFILT